jgi:hypothetical protein
MVALFTSFGHGLPVFLTRGFVEYGQKIVPLIFACQTKSFHLKTVKFCTDHYRTDTKIEEKNSSNAIIK